MNEHAMLDETCWMKQLKCKIRFHATFEFSSNIHPTKMLDEMLHAFAPAFKEDIFVRGQFHKFLESFSKVD